MKQAKKKDEIRRPKGYTSAHARSGVDAPFPKIETWPNQYGSSYEIEIVMPEFTSVCPKTGLPDHGTVRLIYTPGKECLELKSLKMYTLAYRNLGIFQENVVNRFLKDVVESCHPVAAKVIGDFTPRGGISTKVTATYRAQVVEEFK
jgi:7-cyano-7-deazaguanine reductase